MKTLFEEMVAKAERAAESIENTNKDDTGYIYAILALAIAIKESKESA